MFILRIKSKFQSLWRNSNVHVGHFKDGQWTWHLPQTGACSCIFLRLWKYINFYTLINVYLWGQPSFSIKLAKKLLVIPLSVNDSFWTYIIRHQIQTYPYLRRLVKPVNWNQPQVKTLWLNLLHYCVQFCAELTNSWITKFSAALE